MIVDSVAIPDELCEALVEDRLVVFAGAGVSMQGEIPLPPFADLVRQIARSLDPLNKCKILNSDADSCEASLGRLSEMGDIHGSCASIIGGAKGFSDLHSNILSLFGKSERVRVVTTNFDLRFNGAAEFLGLKPRVYQCPALPLGNDFNGIVYLHGNTLHPSETVLSDVDFGKAYISIGWASRFLVDMFSAYTVLFVGYSCGDMMVKYLARSLSADVRGKAYVLEVDDAQFGKWKSLGVEPIRFDAYGQLPEVFYQWGQRSKSSLYERVCRVEALARLDRELDVFEIDELRSLLFGNQDDGAALALARAFALNAVGINSFRNLISIHRVDFLSSEKLSAADSELFTWAVETFVTENYQELFAELSKANIVLSIKFNTAALHQLANGDATEDAISFWLSYFQPVRLQDAGVDFAVRKICSKVASPDLFLRCLDLLFSVRGAWDDFGIGAGKIVPKFYYKIYNAGHSWSSLLVEKTPFMGVELLRFLCDVLNRVSLIRCGYRRNKAKFDADSFSRSAIEPHEQDQHAEGALSSLIDSAREVGLRLLEDGQFQWDDVESLSCSDCSLVSRLGLYLCRSGSFDPDEAMNLLIESRAFEDLAAKHEVYFFAKRYYVDSSNEMKRRFVESFNDAHSTGDDEGAKAYPRFSLYRWLANSLSEKDPILESELLSISSSFPNFELSEYPDLSSYCITGFTGEDGPISESEFSANGLIELYLEQQNSHLLIDFEQQVRTTCNVHPQKVMGVAEELADLVQSGDGRALFILKNILCSVQWADLTCEPMAGRIDLFERLLLIDGLEGPLTLGFQDMVHKSKSPFDLNDLFGLAKAMLEKGASTYFVQLPLEDDIDWMLQAMNCPLGRLVLASEELSFKLADCGQGMDGRNLVKKSLLPFVESPVLTREESCIAAAALLANINSWTRFFPDVAQGCLLRRLEPNCGAFEGAIWGLSYVSSAYDAVWAFVRDRWPLFVDDLGKPLSDALWRVRRYFLVSSLVFDIPSKKQELFSACVNSSSCTESAVRVLVDHICSIDLHDAEQEWEVWIKKCLSKLMDRQANFERAGHLLRKLLILDDVIAKDCIEFLASHMGWTVDYIFLEEDEVDRLAACKKASVSNIVKVLLMHIKSRSHGTFSDRCVDSIVELCIENNADRQLMDLVRDGILECGLSLPKALK